MFDVFYEKLNTLIHQSVLHKKTVQDFEVISKVQNVGVVVFL